MGFLFILVNGFEERCHGLKDGFRLQNELDQMSGEIAWIPRFTKLRGQGVLGLNGIGRTLRLLIKPSGQFLITG